MDCALVYQEIALLAGIAALLSLSAVGLLALFYGFLLAERQPKWPLWPAHRNHQSKFIR